jgi:methyl-accepting chemotaxis protein
MRQRRKCLIIEGNFQARFILRFVLVIIGATLLSTGAILGVFFFKYQFGGADLRNMIIVITDKGTTDVSSFFNIIIIPLIVANLLVLCIIIPYSLFYSHKIAGPVFRLEQSIDLMLGGEMDFVISLRKNDEFRYLGDKMNALVDYLRRNIGEVKSSYRVMEGKVKRMSDMIRTGNYDQESLNKELLDLQRFFKERGKPFNY